MAGLQSVAVATPSAHVVGNMFVEHYYSILHLQPEEVHKFYKDFSVVSRPDSNGEMHSITTMKAIDEKVMSLDYKHSTVEIKTVDAQQSYKDGVIVLVTGLLTGKDNRVQKFTQTFFLAPMEPAGYFVLNDVFRFVADDTPLEAGFIVDNELDGTGEDSPPPTDLGAVFVHETSNHMTASPDENMSCNRSLELTENDHSVVHDIPKTATTNGQDIAAPENEKAQSDSKYVEDTPKKSYASIVKVTRGPTTSPTLSSAKVRMAVAKVEEQPAKHSVVASPVVKVQTVKVNDENTDKQPVAIVSASPSGNSNGSEINNPPEEAVGYSIYVRNLPLNATPSQVESEFKKFGDIKPGGVQVRNNKQNGYCFGFVEFESLQSMESAIEASVIIAGRRIVVEEKKTTTRVGPGGISISSSSSGRGRFPPSRGGFRNDNFRGYGMRNDNFRGNGIRNYGFQERGGYNGSAGRGFGRNDFRNQGEFFHHGRGASRAAEGFQRVGRLNMNQTAISAA